MTTANNDGDELKLKVKQISRHCVALYIFVESQKKLSKQWLFVWDISMCVLCLCV